MRNTILNRWSATAALAATIALAAPVALASTAGLFGLELTTGERSSTIVLDARGEFTHQSFRMDGPDRLVIDLAGAVKDDGVGTIAGDGRFVRSVRTSQYRSLPDPVTRVVIDLVGNPGTDVSATADGLQVVVGEVAARLDHQGPSGNAHGIGHGNAAMGLELAPDNWQDASGLSRISQPDRREEDASYSRTMSINMQNADIRTILRAIADFSGRNIIASPEVKGTVTVALADVPWREALDVILKAHAFGFVEENGIIRVDTADRLREAELAEKTAAKQNEELEPLVTRVVPIDFANASEISAAMQSMVSNRGGIEIDERTNSLIVTDISANIEIVQKLARELDTKTPQVHIDALLVDMDTRRSQEIGIDWGVLNAAPSELGGAVGDLTVSNPINDVAGQLRVGKVFNWAEVRGAIQGLARENIANIISNPRITTTNNREASILVGQKIPLITTDVAGNPITRLETIGIRLVVTPRINSDRQITLDVHPEVSDLSSQATVQGGVIINTSEADTRVLVNNRETAVIGGLIRSLESDFEAGVPVLKDLPLLGALFRTTSKNDEQRELVVFLTPTIVGESLQMEERFRDLKQELDESLLKPGVKAGR